MALRNGDESPSVVGVPLITPVVAFSDNPAGKTPLNTCQAVTGPLEKSGACEKATPTFPVKLWPGVITGPPLAIEIVAEVAELVPPAPEAEMLIVKVPLAVGVPVMTPFVFVKPEGNPVTVTDVTGAFSTSSNNMVPLKAAPTVPEKV